MSSTKEMTTEELLVFKRLLKKYCAQELDQWQQWWTPTEFGPVYISITRYEEYGRQFEELK